MAGRKAKSKKGQATGKCAAFHGPCPNKHVAERHDALCPHSGHQRGQATPELIIVVAGLLILLLAVLAIYNGMNKRASEIEMRLDARRVAIKLASAISYTSQSGNNTIFYVYNFGNPDFNVSLQGRYVIANYANTYETAAMITDKVNITGNTSIPMNQDIRIWNSNGVVYVSQA